MAAREIAGLLRAIADMLERSDPEQLKIMTDLLSKQQRSSRKSVAKQSKGSARPDLTNVVARLLAANSREEGHGILEELELTRRELSQIGREADVHIVREDNVEMIEQKIVEALIGSRLSSSAIRGEK